MLPERLRRLIQLLSRLPGVGEKTAQRYALFLATDGGSLGEDLGRELDELRRHLGSCHRCGNLATLVDRTPPECDICRDDRRNPALLCIVGRVQDLLAVERSGAMRGRYFVLGKLLSPLDGIGPEELPLPALRQRIRDDGVREIIVATPPSVDGEATALLLARELGSEEISVSRIASGIPHGGDLEFSDQITLGRAISGRRSIDVPR